MRTWDYRGFAIEPDLASLEQIFYPKKNAVFLLKIEARGVKTGPIAKPR